jgi:hypothetical protein
MQRVPLEMQRRQHDTVAKKGRQTTRTDHALKSWVSPLDFGMFHRHLRRSWWRHSYWNRLKRRTSGAWNQSAHGRLLKRRKPRMRGGALSTRNAYTRRSDILRSTASARRFVFTVPARVPQARRWMGHRVALKVSIRPLRRGTARDTRIVASKEWRLGSFGQFREFRCLFPISLHPEQ